MIFAGVMELADVLDSKSSGSDTVPVRPRSPAPKPLKPPASTVKETKYPSGCSAVGSAPALGAGCREFEPLHSDHVKNLVNLRFARFFAFIQKSQNHLTTTCCPTFTFKSL